jgi:hypothetical protein
LSQPISVLTLMVGSPEGAPRAAPHLSTNDHARRRLTGRYFPPMNARHRGILALTLACLAAAAIGVAGCGGEDDDGPSTQGNEELLTSDGFGEALDAVAEEAGDDAEVISIQVTQAGADFKLQGGEGVTGLIYTGGELQEVQVDVIGPIDSGGSTFPLSEVDPDAIDRIIDGVREEAGDDAAVTALALEQGGIGELRWTINTRAGAVNRVFRAAPDGTLEG